jgi:hypothetical protein
MTAARAAREDLAVHRALVMQSLGCVGIFLSALGCTSSNPSPSASDASSPTDALLATPDGAYTVGLGDGPAVLPDASAAPCGVAPYPNGLACDNPVEACLPEAGFDCCVCQSTTNCRYPTQWGCQSSDPGCPQVPPAVGSTCSLPQFSTCVYCSQPAVIVACSNGSWQPVSDHAYCQVTD